ncbi:proteasome assembly chaperone 2-like [Styela clava]
MEFFALLNEEINFENYTLVVPAVSVGNVGQLACDLLINTLELNKVGYLRTSCVLPVVGSNAFCKDDSDNSLTLTLELFIDDSKKLAVSQQRAPLVAGKQKQYSTDFVSWINSKGFSEVILLTSCHAYERTDNEIRNSPVRFLVHPDDKKNKRELTDKKFLELQKRLMDSGDKNYFFPGGGFAKNFHDECVTSEPNFFSVILMIFCSEGDNIPEAVLLANALNSWKNYRKISEDNGKTVWSFPASWKHLYGARQPLSIF